jgi:uncharacterized protein YecT (DUF1311 family)
MKVNKIVFSLLFLICGLPCDLSAQTQGEMNDEAYENYKKADKELNEVYQRLIKRLDKKEKAMLVQSQKDWLKFRDSHCDFTAEENEGGSMQPMVWAMCLEEKTRERITDLKECINSRGL